MNVVLCIFIVLNSYNPKVSVIRSDSSAPVTVRRRDKKGGCGRWSVVGGDSKRKHYFHSVVQANTKECVGERERWEGNVRKDFPQRKGGERARGYRRGNSQV